MDIMDEINKKRRGEDRDFIDMNEIRKESAPDMSGVMRDYAPVIDQVIADFGVTSEYAVYEEDGHIYMCMPSAYTEPKKIDGYTYTTEGNFTVVQLDALNKECGGATAGSGGYSNARYSDKEKKSKTKKNEDEEAVFCLNGNPVGGLFEFVTYLRDQNPDIIDQISDDYGIDGTDRDAIEEWLANTFDSGIYGDDYEEYGITVTKSKVRKSTEALLCIPALNQWYLLRSNGYPDYVCEEFAIHMTDYGDTPEDNAEFLREYCERVYDARMWIGNVSHYYVVENNDIREVKIDDARAMVKSKTKKNNTWGGYSESDGDFIYEVRTKGEKISIETFERPSADEPYRESTYLYNGNEYRIFDYRFSPPYMQLIKTKTKKSSEYVGLIEFDDGSTSLTKIFDTFEGADHECSMISWHLDNVKSAKAFALEDLVEQFGFDADEIRQFNKSKKSDTLKDIPDARYFEKAQEICDSLNVENESTICLTRHQGSDDVILMIPKNKISKVSELSKYDCEIEGNVVSINLDSIRKKSVRN